MHEAYAFNLNHLRYFYEVARAGNMRRAARRIGISQPALSKQIQALEESVELTLFYRSSKGLKPTPEGEIVAAHCERVFGHLRDLEEAIDALRTGSAGRVTIGAIYSISEHLLPSYIRRYHHEFPKVRLKIVSGQSAQVLQALREHRVDVGFVAGAPDGDEFVCTPFAENKLIPVAAPSHPLSGRTIQIDALDGVSMIAFDEPAPTRLMTELYLDEQSVEPRIVAECPSIATIKQLVQEGVGFAVLPARSVTRELESGELSVLDVAGWELHRELYVVHHQAPKLPPAARRFVELMAPQA